MPHNELMRFPPLPQVLTNWKDTEAQILQYLKDALDDRVHQVWRKKIFAPARNFRVLFSGH